MTGEATPAQIGALLMGLRVKGETVDEITGFAEAMREHVVPVLPTRSPVVDVVGTGGDGARTFNISTAAAIVAAAAGGAVAKHGNRAASSACGSADVLEALGLSLELPPERIAASIDDERLRVHVRPSTPSGDAPRRAGPPGARHANRVQRPRPAREPGGRPGRGLRRLRAVARPHVRGVARESRRPASVRRSRRRDRRAFPDRGRTWSSRCGRERSSSGSSTRGRSASSHATGPSSAAATRRRTQPRSNGCSRASAGGRRDAVLLNAAAALVAAGLAVDLADGMGAAAEAVDTGAAGETLERLVAFSAEAPV